MAKLITRRNVLALLGAPVIVRLMPPQPLLQDAAIRPGAGFCQRLMYNQLASDLKAGRMTTVVINGAIVPEVDARRMVAYARANGWLPSS
jgi:hypothetical protein